MADRKPNILIAEDEPVIALDLQLLIESLDCFCIGPVPTLAAAIDAVQSEEIDAAILDILLGKDRIGPVAEILERRGIPFIFTTGTADDDRDGRWWDRPILRKPYKDSEVRKVISRQLGWVQESTVL